MGSLRHRHAGRLCPLRISQATTGSIEHRIGQWTRDEERALDTQGLVALGPLAMSCLAVQAGFTITVESEYLPKHLINGRWHDDVLT
ncbi:Imm49 family immunity protein [Streptomyces muensis]|uniref:Immunity 49 family protein n=1 Tax=Streptomyces muensis TaxID=1077944 RepID=A0A9X1PZU6_STRM4|nr:Imm49 family immunity protein [Streptomyces muensis]MCF1596048.1 immunity 49 family protein [Streptomyces muensis]